MIITTDQTMIGVGDGRNTVETVVEIGDTVDAYVTVYSANLQWAKDTVIVVANTDTANDLTYEVLVYSNHDSGEAYTLTTANVAFGDEAAHPGIENIGTQELQAHWGCCA